MVKRAERLLENDVDSSDTEGSTYELVDDLKAVNAAQKKIKIYLL